MIHEKFVIIMCISYWKKKKVYLKKKKMCLGLTVTLSA